MAIIYDFGNSQNWQFHWGEEAIAQNAPVSQLDEYYPIDNINVPIQFSSEIIAVYAESNTDPGNWEYAGLVLQKVNTGITGGGMADGYINSRKFYLKQINIVRFERLSTTYAVQFRIPYWLRHISLTVWQYTGLIDDTIQLHLDEIEGKVDLIQETLEDLI